MLIIRLKYLKKGCRMSMYIYIYVICLTWVFKYTFIFYLFFCSGRDEASFEVYANHGFQSFRGSIWISNRCIAPQRKSTPLPVAISEASYSPSCNLLQLHREGKWWQTEKENTCDYRFWLNVITMFLQYIWNNYRFSSSQILNYGLMYDTS